MPKTKITLTVPMSEADLGQAAKVGDTIEVDAEVAERYVAAGIAEAGEKPAAPAEEPPEKPAGGATGRRSSGSS